MGTWVSYFTFLGINFVHYKTRALEWIIFNVPYNSQQSHRKETTGIIWGLALPGLRASSAQNLELRGYSRL